MKQALYLHINVKLTNPLTFACNIFHALAFIQLTKQDNKKQTTHIYT